MRALGSLAAGPVNRLAGEGQLLEQLGRLDGRVVAGVVGLNGGSVLLIAWIAQEKMAGWSAPAVLDGPRLFQSRSARVKISG